MKEFNDQLKKLRRDKEISQKKLGLIMNVSQQTIDAWENKRAQPDIETMKRLAIFFDVSVDYLIGYSDYPYSYDPRNKDIKFDYEAGQIKLKHSEKGK
jgi:transcriptional regulator with XRE-family HTH domain